MGCYINPPNKSKEAFLKEHGVRTNGPCEITETHLPVVWVDNGPFSAAGVAYSKDEADAFNSPADNREKIWFKVSRELLRTVSDLSRYEK